MNLSQVKGYIYTNLYTGVIKTIFTLVLSVFSIPYIVSRIGIDEFGVVSIVLIFSSFTGLFDLGLSKSLIFFQENRDENRQEVSAVYFLNFSLVIFFILLSVFVFFYEINFLGRNLPVDASILRYINTIALLLLALEIFNNLLRASLEADFKLEIVNWGFLTQSLIIHVGWLLLSIISADLLYFIFVPVLGSICTIIYHFYKLGSFYKYINKPKFHKIKSVLNITSSFFKVGALNAFHLPLVKYSLIVFIGDPKAIGIFELASKLVGLSSNLFAYISNPIFSITARNRDNNYVLVWEVVKKTTLFIVLLALFAYLFFVIFNNFIIFYFYKEYSNEIFKVLNFLLIGYLFIASSESVQKFMLGIGKVNRVAFARLMGVLLCIASYCVLIFLGLFDLVNVVFVYALSLVIISFYWLSFIFRSKFYL